MAVDLRHARSIGMLLCNLVPNSISPVSCNCASSRGSNKLWSRIGVRGRRLAAFPFDQASDNHAAASRPAWAVSRRSRNRTRPWSIRASGTAKVGTMTSG